MICLTTGPLGDSPEEGEGRRGRGRRGEERGRGGEGRGGEGRRGRGEERGERYIYIWNILCDFDACEFIYIASNPKRNIFQTVYALDFLFSALHTTPFLYAKIHFGVLHLLRDSIATFDTPPGSNPL